MRAVIVAAFAALLGCFFYFRQPPCDVAWLGDSIFSQMKNRRLGPPFERLCNLAKSGAPAGEIAKMSVPSSARVVFFEGGINDILSGWPDDGIFQAYKDGLARLADRKVIAIGVLPVSQSLMPADYAQFATQERLDTVNSGIKAICAGFAHCRWGGLASPIFAPDRLTTDGIHLNTDGRSALVALLAKAMPPH